MADKVRIAYVYVWDILAGAVSWDERKGYGTFGFDDQFLDQGLDLAPLTMPLRVALNMPDPVFEFPGLPKNTFSGLPGLLADSLPDHFGHEIINAWLARQGRDPKSFTTLERLCYTGKRGMGALEFKPVLHKDIEKSVPVEVSRLMELAGEILSRRENLKVSIQDSEAMKNILRVGTSAGGSRPKAVIAYNEKSGRIRSGQVKAPKGYSYWLLKFDGVKGNALGDPAGYSNIEYAYSRLAGECGIDMTECRLLSDGDRHHFMTRRFDRGKEGEKVHSQTMCALGHLSFKDRFSHSYEQAFQMARELRLPYPAGEQLFRRMVFNVVGMNRDDHTKNISFLMDRKGQWRLSPAYDMTYAYNPTGDWTREHQMSINAKRSGITSEDLHALAVSQGIKSYKPIIEQITEVFSRWPRIAKDCGVSAEHIAKIANIHQLKLQ